VKLKYWLELLNAMTHKYICVSDMTHTWYMHIEKCIIILKNMINIWLLLYQAKLKSYILKLLT